MFIIDVDGTEYDLETYSSAEELAEAVNADRYSEWSETMEEGDEFEEWSIQEVWNNTSWDDSNIHSKYQNADCFDYIDAYNYLERQWGSDTEEFLDAAIYCEVDISTPSHIMDKYIGVYKSDEDYAIEYAEQSEIDLSKWPYTCIDWERAARDLMYGISSSGNYYFYD